MSVSEKPPRIVRVGWRLEQARGAVSLPVGRTLGSLLFYGRPVVANILSLLMQILVWEPALRYRCRTLGTGLRLVGSAPSIMGDGDIDIGTDLELAAACSFVVGFGLPTRPSLRIGNNVHIGSHNIICAAKGVTIGDHCRTGPFVSIYDTDVHPFDARLRREDAGTVVAAPSAPIVIENDVWLGVGSIVLKGVTIGRGTIVGAGAVVTRDIPAGAVAAGNPAAVVGQAS